MGSSPAQRRDPRFVSPVRDRFLCLGVAVWILSTLPSFVHLLPAKVTFSWADEFADVPILLLIIWAAVRALGRSGSQRERGFWRLVAMAMTAWLAVRGLFAVIPDQRWGTGADLTSDLLYLGAYLSLAFALERRPDRTPGRGLWVQLQQIEVLGTLVFGGGLLAYFVLIPSVFNPRVYASWVPSLLLFAVLDLYLLVRSVALLLSAPGPEWRRTFILLAATFALLLGGDVVEGLFYLGTLPDIPPGGPLDILWQLPWLTLLAAVQARRWPPVAVPSREVPTSDALRRIAPGGSSLAAFALGLPALHFLVRVLGLSDPLTEGPREVLLLALIVVLGGLLALHQRVMIRTTDSLEADRRMVADQLQASQRMEAVGRLAAGVAHDFSNVLSVIRGRGDLLMMNPELGEGPRGDAAEVVEAARRGESLVSHLMTISRRKSRAPTSLDLSEVAQELRPLLTRALPETVALDFAIHPSPVMAMADRAQVEQVLLNLVLNARDALGGQGHIRVATDRVELDDAFVASHGGEAGGTFTVLRVEDDGPGVSPEIRALAFEPFFTTKEATKGSGLGLSIVYGIAHQAGGFTRITDSQMGGAAVEVYLPVTRAHGAAATASPAAALHAARGTVLVVEDYSALRRTTARVLQEAGYRVLEAESGAEALAILERRREPVDLMLADVVLPDVPGAELEARALRRRPGLPTLFVSGYPEGVTPLRVPENRPVMEKPFSPETLLAAVQEALGDRARTFTG